MVDLPIIHIIFYLATLFLPAKTTKFTATYQGHKMTWTQRADGWHASAEGGRDMGKWSVDGPSRVTSTTEKGESKKDLSNLIKVGVTSITVRGVDLNIVQKPGTATLSQDKDSALFHDPLVVEYFASDQPAAPPAEKK